MAPRARKRKAPVQKFSTKLKRAPVKTLKQSWRSMGVIGKGASVAIAAGLLGGQAASQVNNLPVVGRFMRIGTTFGANLRRRLRI